MFSNKILKEKIFNINTDDKFNELALEIFRYQYKNNNIYRAFINRLNINPAGIVHFSEIPFLPVEFFKNYKVSSIHPAPVNYFSSSGTSGSIPGKHYYSDLKIYERSFTECFRFFFGKPSDYCILALLPSYLERTGSSLVYMIKVLIEKSNNPDSGFYLYDQKKLAEKLTYLENNSQKTILIGVSFALLDLVENHRFDLKNTLIMETGGMKGKRKEIIREELHKKLCEGFGIKNIYSEYGMTELFSQAYSKGSGIFYTPPWMKILIRDINDPLALTGNKTTGGINIIDLANIDSCSFIATQDLGKTNNDGSFEVLGRFDNSDIRGCNLMID